MPRVRRQKAEPNARNKRSLQRSANPLQTDLIKIAQITYQKVARGGEDTSRASSPAVTTRRQRREETTTDLMVGDERQQKVKQAEGRGSSKAPTTSSTPLLQQQADQSDNENQSVERPKQSCAVSKSKKSRQLSEKAPVENGDEQEIRTHKDPSTDSVFQKQEITNSSNNSIENGVKVEEDDTAMEEKRKTRSASVRESSTETDNVNASNSRKRVAATPEVDDDTASHEGVLKKRATKRAKVAPRWHNQSYMLFLALRQHPDRCLPRGELCRAAVEMDKKISAELNLPRVFVGKTPLNSASAKLTVNLDHYFVPFRPEGSKSMYFRLAYEPGDVKTAVQEYQKWWKKLIEHDWPYCFGIPKPEALAKREANAKSKQEQTKDIARPTPDTNRNTNNEKKQNVDDKENESSENAAGHLEETVMKQSAPTSPTGIITGAITLLQSDFDLQSIAPNTKNNSEQLASPNETVGTPSSAGLDNTPNTDTDREVQTPQDQMPNDVTSVIDCTDERKQMNQADEKNEKSVARDADNTESSDHQQLGATSVMKDAKDGCADTIRCEPKEMDRRELSPVSFANKQADSNDTKDPTTSFRLTDRESFEQTNIPSTTTLSSSISKTETPELATSQSTHTHTSRVEEASDEPAAYTLDELDLSNIPTSWRDIVYVAPSKIPGAGKGLFAKRKLPYNTPIGFYFGVPMTEDEFDAIKDRVGRASEYSIMYRRTVLDATDEEGEPVTDENSERFCPFHFMNETNEKNASISFVEGAIVNQVICWTQKEIEKDEELLVWYGSDIQRHWYGKYPDGGTNTVASGNKESSALNNNTHRKARTKTDSTLRDE